MDAAILAVGDELLGGRCQDTNSTWLCGRCAGLGIRVIETRTVGDDLGKIVDSLQSLSRDVDLVILTGGLGPTQDDLTREAVANFLSSDLIEDSQAMGWLTEFFASRSLEMGESQRRLAMRPSNATCHRNHAGTAPGIHVRGDQADYWLLPGPPFEMHDLWDRHVELWLRDELGGVPVSESVDLKAFGLIEARFEELLGDLTKRDQRPLLGTRVSQDEFLLHVDSVGVDAADMDACIDICLERLHPWIYGRRSGTLASIVGSLLLDRGERLATAESCTGGWIGREVVDVPGSSSWFEGGWVVYSNEMKSKQLDVDRALIEHHGAVSEPVVQALAQRAAEKAEAQWSLSVSGIAGPQGGTVDKPVGTVWIGCHGPDGTISRCFNLGKDRTRIRRRTVSMALQLLRWRLLGEDPMTPTSWDIT